jgi:hypothetical protein
MDLSRFFKYTVFQMVTLQKNNKKGKKKLFKIRVIKYDLSLITGRFIAKTFNCKLYFNMIYPILNNQYQIIETQRNYKISGLSSIEYIPYSK